VSNIVLSISYCCAYRCASIYCWTALFCMNHIWNVVMLESDDEISYRNYKLKPLRILIISFDVMPLFHQCTTLEDLTALICMGLWNPIIIKANFFFPLWTHHVVILPCTTNYAIKVLYFPQIFYHTPLWGTGINPTSQVCSPDMLVLLTAENSKVKFHCYPQWRKVHTKFHPNLSSTSQAESCRQTDEET
jgi:hypothetical protein